MPGPGGPGGGGRGGGPGGGMGGGMGGPGGGMGGPGMGGPGMPPPRRGWGRGYRRGGCGGCLCTFLLGAGAIVALIVMMIGFIF